MFVTFKGVVCLRFMDSVLFYRTLFQSKVAPHVLDGRLLPTDLMSGYSIYSLYLLVLCSCLYAFYVMSQVCHMNECLQ